MSNVRDFIVKAREFSKDLKEEVTHFDRVMFLLKHIEPYRVLMMPFTQTFSATFAEIPFSKYISDEKLIAKS